MVVHTGFLIAEDAAVKQRFSTLTVADDRNGSRPVDVFFRYPEGETERKYPFITIENIDINNSRQRQHSEVTVYTPNPYSTDASAAADFLTYWPDTLSSLSASTPTVALKSEEFVPIDLLYQVSTYARSALHDRQLTSQMLSKYAPFRYGFIYVESDNTVRRFDLLDWITADLLDPEAGYRKRIFRKVYTLQMSAELPSSGYTSVKRVSQVKNKVATAVPAAYRFSSITEEF